MSKQTRKKGKTNYNLDVDLVLTETIQFYIPRAAADALPIEQIGARARAAGVERPRLEYSTMGVRPGTIRITWRTPMALFLGDELRVLAGKAEAKDDAELLKHCVAAVATVMGAIEPAARAEAGLTSLAGNGPLVAEPRPAPN
jgi:hypothetical protein